MLPISISGISVTADGELVLLLTFQRENSSFNWSGVKREK